MADYKKDDSPRRDYGRVGEKTAEGRVLRSRRPRVSKDEATRSEKVEFTHSSGEHRGYARRDGEGHSHGYEGKGQYDGPRKSYGARSGQGGGYHHREEGQGDGESRRSSFKGSYGHRDGEFRKNASSRAAGTHGNRPAKASYGKGASRKPSRKGGYKYSFSERDEENMGRILSRKPQLENMNASDYDSAPVLAKDEMRLNKFIANSGICSRREADTLIQAGVVTVNGQVVTELGTKVNVFNDDVRFNGERVRGEEKVYIVMNKPKGYVTTTSDPHAEKTVMDLLKDCPSRVFPVGRLDKATTGVLMFTNDGEIAERLTHPSYDKKKIYQVILDHELKQEDYDKILSGIELNDGVIAADELSYIDENDHRKLGIEIHSGKNRIVRRIFESLGYDVRALDRVYFAGVTKKNLKRGEWRYLSEKEANMLKMGAYV